MANKTIATLLTGNQQKRNIITVQRDRLAEIQRMTNPEAKAAAMIEMLSDLESLIEDSTSVIVAKRTFKVNPKNEPIENPVRVTFVVKTRNARAVKELVKTAFELNFYPNCKKTAVAEISLIRVYETNLQYGMQLQAAYPEMILQVYAGKDEGNLDLTIFAQPVATEEGAAEAEQTEPDAMVEPAATPEIEATDDAEVTEEVADEDTTVEIEATDDAEVTEEVADEDTTVEMESDEELENLID